MARDWLDILQEMEQWSRDLDRFMTHVNTRSQSLVSSTHYTPWSPTVNIYETEDSIWVLAEVAGLSPEEVNIKYEANRLLVWGERHPIIPENIRAVHRMEIQMGQFAFMVELPGTVSAQDAEAWLDMGILHIRLPKKSAPSGGMIQIRAESQEEKDRGNE